ncbi:probable peptidoglycan muropeptide transporter SLC46 isoform X2 [Hetaerina americana]
MSIPTLPVECFLISSLPLAFSGGWTTFAGAVISVIGDETGEDGSQRTSRLGLLPAFYFMGFLPGSLSSSVTLNTLGNTGVFLLASGACFLALLIALCTVSGTYATSTGDEGRHESGLVKDVLQTLLKKRSNGQKIYLILSILSNGSSTMVSNGESNLYYMHGRKEFGWEIIDFILYRSVTNGLQMMGAIFAVSILSHKMKIADAPLAIFSYLGSSVGSIIMAFASTTWMMYCGSAISLLQGAASPVMRSIMSRSVPHDELGRAFTLSTSFEALAPVAAQPLYTYLFRKTLISFPGAFFMLSSVMFSLALMFSCIIHGTHKWHSRSERKSLLPREDSTSKLPD